jgi:hypothetical protein
MINLSDSHDKPIIVFYKYDKGLPVVTYAKWTGSSWDFQIVSDSHNSYGQPAFVNSMVVGSNGRVHLVTDTVVGTENTAYFYGDLSYATFDTQPLTPNSFPTTIIAVVIGVVVIGTVLLLYFKKRRHN